MESKVTERSSVETNEYKKEVPEVKPSSTEDECVEENSGSDDDGTFVKYSSPEAGEERLGKIPKEILTLLQTQSMETSFGAMITEVKRRCDEVRETLQPLDIKRMWTQMVFGWCMDFRRTHFPKKRTFNQALDQTSNECVPLVFSNYMKNTDLVDLLQMFIDIAQQNGFHAQQNKHNLDEVSRTKRVSQQMFNDAQNYCDTLQQLYHDFVDLYRHCTGTWRPPRVPRYNRGPQREPRRDFNGRGQYTEDPRPMQNFAVKPSQERKQYTDSSTRSMQNFAVKPSQERRPYRPGGYPVTDDRRQYTSRFDNTESRPQRYMSRFNNDDPREDSNHYTRPQSRDNTKDVGFRQPRVQQTNK
jgi:hypothetical protein